MSLFFFVRPDAAQVRDDFRAALSAPNVRRVFRSLLSDCDIMGGMGLDGTSLEYRQGKRDVGLRLAQQIESAMPGQVAALMRESGEEYAAFIAAQKEKKQ